MRCEGSLEIRRQNREIEPELRGQAMGDRLESPELETHDTLERFAGLSLWSLSGIENRRRSAWRSQIPRDYFASNLVFSSQR